MSGLRWGMALCAGMSILTAPLSAEKMQTTTTAAETTVVEVKRIWDQDPHNAFTDLVRFRGKFYCVFRSAGAHVPKDSSQDGRIRLLASADGNKWDPVALFALDKMDLRDPKLSVTPDGRLMVLIGGSFYQNGKLLKRQPYVSFSRPDGKSFTDLVPVKLDSRITGNDDWLWRVTWHDGVAYGVVYQGESKGEWGLHLVKSSDGVNYELVKTLPVTGHPNESTIYFTPDGEMNVVVRREADSKSGMLGHSRSPYQDWTWNEMDMRVGGPAICVMPNGTVVLGTRQYEPEVKTVLGLLTPNGKFTKTAEFPSAGDTSYPGIAFHDGLLWVSYYSSHEGRTSIYVAKVKPAGI